MKRIITIFILTLILGLGAVQLIYQDEINLFEFARQKLVRGAERIISKPTPIRYVTDLAPSDTVHNGTFPEWQNDPTKQRRLVLQYQIGEENENAFRFREVIDIEFDGEGSLYVLDFGNKSIEVFDSAGQHVRTLGIGKNRKRFMFKPTDLALHPEGRVYVSDRRKGILIFEPEGSLRKTVSLDYKVEQLAMTPNGGFVALTPEDKYLLHKFNSKGREVLAFAPQQEPSAALRQVFGEAKLAVDSDGSVYLSYVYPYRILKFNPEGRAVLSFKRDLGIQINPPTIYRRKDGSIKNVFRQEISYDTAIGADGLLYNLVRTKGARGGNIVDAFSVDGNYLQSFFLGHHARNLGFRNNRMALLLVGDVQTIAVYDIERTGS